MEIDVEVDGQKLTAELHTWVEGKYYPQTRHEPAEYPELFYDVIGVTDEEGFALPLTPEFKERVLAAVHEKNVEQKYADEAYESRDPQRDFDDYLMREFY